MSTTRQVIARFVQGVVALAMLAILPMLQAGYDPEPREATRFAFDFDGSVLLRLLIPAAPAASRTDRNVLIDDLSEAPEILMQESTRPLRTEYDDECCPTDATGEARKSVAHLLAKINHINQRGTDRFIAMLKVQRADLAGLPFSVGEAARLTPAARREFGRAVADVRQLQGPRFAVFPDGRVPISRDPAAAAALAQMLWTAAHVQTPSSSSHSGEGLVEILDRNRSGEATRALMRLAVFSSDDQQRSAALAILRNRNTSEASDIIQKGLRYPWPGIVRNAADAVVVLARHDLGYQLADMLDAADPRAPSRETVDGNSVHVVRELVRINHERNCLLCHPPANTPDVVRPGPVNDRNMFVDREVAALTGQTPVPGEGLPIRDFRYDPFATEFPDLLVRADVTYLRQDFSLLQHVAHADPWPTLQRFDYLVRTRVLNSDEAQDLHKKLAARSDFAEHRHTALAALRGLTGVDAGESADAWRDVLWTAAAWRTARLWTVVGCFCAAGLLVGWRWRLAQQLVRFAQSVALTLR